MSVGINFVALNVASLASQVITVVIALLVARQWGEARFGQYTFVLYLAGLVAILVDFGIESNVVRAVARNRWSTSTYVINGLLLKSVLGAVAWALIALLAWGLDSFRPLAAALLAGGAYVILRTILAFLWAIFRAHERMDVAAGMTLISKAVLLAVTALVIGSGGSLAVLFGSYVAVQALLIGLTLAYLAFGWMPAPGRIDLTLLRGLALGSVPFAIYVVCSAMVGQIDIVVVRHFHGDAMTGYYGAALTVITAMAFLPANATQALYPRLSQLVLKDRGVLGTHLRTAGSLALWCGLLIAAGGSLFAGPAIRVFGPSYLPAVPALALLMCAFGVDCMACVFQSALLSTNHESAVAKAYMILTVLYLLAIWWVIPRYGLVGAALMRLVLSSVFFGVWWRLIQREFPQVQLIGVPSLQGIRSLMQARPEEPGRLVPEPWPR